MNLNTEFDFILLDQLAALRNLIIVITLPINTNGEEM